MTHCGVNFLPFQSIFFSRLEMDTLLFHILFPPVDGLIDRGSEGIRAEQAGIRDSPLRDPTLPLMGHRKGPGPPEEERQDWVPSAWDWLASPGLSSHPLHQAQTFITEKESSKEIISGSTMLSRTEHRKHPGQARPCGQSKAPGFLSTTVSGGAG